MNYQEELREKLDAVHTQGDTPTLESGDVSKHEQRLLDEISLDLEFSQYDLDENDVLRTLKIMDIVTSYPDVFTQKNALKVFYVLCRVDAITAKSLHKFCALKVDEFKSIINAMAKAGLVVKNNYNELELTLKAQSLAERMGIGFY